MAVWMLGMQFFYMEKNFYAGQFTKTVYPLFPVFNRRIAHYFIVLMNKNQKVYQWALVRDFEELFKATSILLPVKNWGISFEYIEKYIQALEAERLEELEAERLEELEAYLLATGLKDYQLTQKEQESLDLFKKISIVKPTNPS